MKPQHKLSELPPVIQKALARYVNAKINVSWMGGVHPADWPTIKRELRVARQQLIESLKDELKMK